MRISFGGGPRRSRNGGRLPYEPGISFELGPVGSCIVSVGLILLGAFLLLISFDVTKPPQKVPSEKPTAYAIAIR